MHRLFPTSRFINFSLLKVNILIRDSVNLFQVNWRKRVTADENSWVVARLGRVVKFKPK